MRFNPLLSLRYAGVALLACTLTVTSSPSLWAHDDDHGGTSSGNSGSGNSGSGNSGSGSSNSGSSSDDGGSSGNSGSGNSGSGSSGGSAKPEDNLSSFTAVVESGPGNGLVGDWRIGGRIVRVSAATLIDTEWGAFAVGSFVEAKGVFGADGVLAATKIEVKTSAAAPGAGVGSGTTAPVPVELKGKIQAVPGGTLLGDWLVSGWTVRVTAATSVNLEHGQAMAGVFVEAKGIRTGAMSIQATSIEVKPSTTTMALVTPMTSMTGVLEDRPANGMLGEWRIDGRRVHVQSETEIELEDETISHRSRLRVTGVERADGVVVASSLRTAPPSTDDSRPLFRISGRVDDNPKPEGIEVEGRKVVIGPTTLVKQEFGSLSSAAFVEVKGRMRDDGTIEAEKVEVLPPPPSGATPAMFREIKGAVERIPSGGGPGLWVVAGKTVRVTAATRIERLFGQAAPGAAVKVEGWSLADGTLEAVEIQALPSRP